MKRRTIIPYGPKLKELARKLRKSSTLSEVLLWQHLKGKQMLGYDFHRQRPIDNYIVDFLATSLC
ncbi:MAG: endonuclease domain-containing protein [Thermodesulfobacteriota bacterium]